ncbi:hypothetical protein CVD28_12685 [Bacillus sp. M6-12]|nr:hypothetical protein CVD28_12685 [Bacillus sp. M6-12]
MLFGSPKKQRYLRNNTKRICNWLSYYNNRWIKGKLDFEMLEGTFVKPWDGMEKSIRICGNLNMDSRSIMYKLEEPSFVGDKPALWCFIIEIFD